MSGLLTRAPVSRKGATCLSSMALSAAFSASGGDPDWVYGHGFVRHAVKHVPVDRGCRFVDIAAGSGSLAVQLAASSLMDGFHLTAVDLDASALDLLTKNAKRCGVADRITALKQDALSLGFADGSFDVAVSAFGVTETSDPVKAVREMARVLAPGGTAVVVGWASTPHSRAFQQSGRALDEFYPHGVPVFGASSIVRLLEGAGLQAEAQFDVAEQTNMIGLINEHFDVMLRRLVPPPPKHLSRAQLKELLQRVYDPASPLEDLAVTITIVVARKPAAAAADAQL